jgi:hypothetical protein
MTIPRENKEMRYYEALLTKLRAERDRLKEQLALVREERDRALDRDRVLQELRAKVAELEEQCNAYAQQLAVNLIRADELEKELRKPHYRLDMEDRS